MILHDALDFGQCHLALGVPSGGKYADVNTLDDLRAMPWSEQTPLRCVARHLPFFLGGVVGAGDGSSAVDLAAPPGLLLALASVRRSLS